MSKQTENRNFLFAGRIVRVRVAVREVKEVQRVMAVRGVTAAQGHQGVDQGHVEHMQVTLDQARNIGVTRAVERLLMVEKIGVDRNNRSTKKSNDNSGYKIVYLTVLCHNVESVDKF